ncbi:MAG: UDP-N-acetylmuramoyl-tripeptide--D-alanyl-D-alanine ligase [Myxococcota bacterium]|nr:UDP-N-acetylmuramoyl-tripeptide--D-alanyl-D-alanine ligase [Myxococcota bacterium]
MGNLNWHIGTVAEQVGGVVQETSDQAIAKVVTDSREDVDNALYIALKGPRFDGHDFVAAVARKGAAAVIVEHSVPALPIPQIVVDNTLQALQTLGAARRRQFNGPVVGITGSSGKTTTRKLVAAIFEERWAVHQPTRNFNNHIGVPLTLLGIEDTHEALVLELGCSDFGEIERLTQIADPDVGVVTNVGPAHLENLKDLEGVKRAKGELFLAMREDARAVINAGDPRVATMPVPSRDSLTFGQAVGVDIRLLSRQTNGLKGQTIALDILGKQVAATLPLIGAHNALNALAAAATAVAAGVDANTIAAGLAAVRPEPGRLTIGQGTLGTLVIDDTYNANPASMRAAIDAACEVATHGRTVAVLGDMLELGEHSDTAHMGVGEYLVASGVDYLVTIGNGGQRIGKGAETAGLAKSRLYGALDHQGAVDYLRRVLQRNDVVLVKGSRGMQMDKLAAMLMEDA